MGNKVNKNYSKFYTNINKNISKEQERNKNINRMQGFLLKNKEIIKYMIFLIVTNHFSLNLKAIVNLHKAKINKGEKLNQLLLQDQHQIIRQIIVE